MSPPSPTTIGPPADAAARSSGNPGPGPGVLRVLVADPQAIDRRALALLLRTQPDMRVVGEAATGDETLALARLHDPHVVVLSPALPASGADPVLRWLLGTLPDLRVLAISERGWEQCVVLSPPSPVSLPLAEDSPCIAGMDCLQLAMAQGALGTVRRSADPEHLFAAVRAVAAGREAHDPAVLASAAQPATARVRASGALSPREIEVAALIGRGHSNKEIAAALGISEPTVKKHVGRVLAKLGVQDRLQAGLFVTRHPMLFASERDRRPDSTATRSTPAGPGP